MENKISNFKLIVKGILIVNLPIVIIILTFWYIFSTFFNLSNGFSVLLGSLLGWFYWEYSIKKWVKWALDNNVEPDRLFKIGQLSLLLWNRKEIDKVLNEIK